VRQGECSVMQFDSCCHADYFHFTLIFPVQECGQPDALSERPCHPPLCASDLRRVRHLSVRAEAKMRSAQEQQAPAPRDA